MPRAVALLVLPFLVAACARDRVEVISQGEAYLAFADVKEQLLDYQNHMEWLAANPDKDEDLREANGQPIYCGRPGGIRLDIASATANLNLETSTGGILGATGTGSSGALTSGMLGLGGSRTGSMSYSYAIELGEMPRVREGGKTPLAQTLLTLRRNFMKSQYARLGLDQGCLTWVPGDGNFATLKLVKSNNTSAGAFFALGPLVINPSVSDSRSLTNTLTVKFILSPQLTESGAPAPRIGPRGTGAGSGGAGPGTVIFGGSGRIGRETISQPMGITMETRPLFPTQ